MKWKNVGIIEWYLQEKKEKKIQSSNHKYLLKKYNLKYKQKNNNKKIIKIIYSDY